MEDMAAMNDGELIAKVRDCLDETEQVLRDLVGAYRDGLLESRLPSIIERAEKLLV